MPVRITSLAAGIALAVARPPEMLTSGSASPWITVVGTAIPIQRPCPIRRGNHRGELTGGAGGVDPAIEGASSTRALVLLVEVEFP